MTSYCISTAARVNYSHPRSVICFVLDPEMDTRSKRRRDFDLKVDGWSDDKENEPVEKRKRLSLNKKKPAERYCLSLGGLRQYEKVTTTQQQAVCRVLSVNTNSTYDNEVSRMSLPSTSSAVPSSHSTSASQVVPSTPTTAAALPQMNFSSCSVHIYQGTPLRARIELMAAI